jgi:hypothetical protein
MPENAMGCIKNMEIWALDTCPPVQAQRVRKIQLIPILFSKSR